MKVERKANKIDEADVFYVEQSLREPLGASISRGGIRKLAPYLAVAVLFSAVTYGVMSYLTPPHLGLKYLAQATSGQIALTEPALRKIVNAEGLKVYWLGPMEGALYSLSLSEERPYVRYLPQGRGLSDPTPNYRVVVTYDVKDAYSVTQANAATTTNGVGFINNDGNAVFYNSLKPTNVYIGVKGSNTQVEIFDPNSGLALIAAQSEGLLSRI